MAKHLTPDQVSFFDENLKKQVEGSYRYDGKALRVYSVKYGTKSAPPAYLGTRVDHFALEFLAQKLLSELARDSELARGAEKDSARPQILKKAA